MNIVKTPGGFRVSKGGKWLDGVYASFAEAQASLKPNPKKAAKKAAKA